MKFDDDELGRTYSMYITTMKVTVNHIQAAEAIAGIRQPHPRNPFFPRRKADRSRDLGSTQGEAHHQVVGGETQMMMMMMMRRSSNVPLRRNEVHIFLVAARASHTP